MCFQEITCEINTILILPYVIESAISQNFYQDLSASCKKDVIVATVIRMHTNMINGEHTWFLCEICNKIHTIIILSDYLNF